MIATFPLDMVRHHTLRTSHDGRPRVAIFFSRQLGAYPGYCVKPTQAGPRCNQRPPRLDIL